MSVIINDASGVSLEQRLDSLASFNRHVAHDLRGPLVSVAAAALHAQQALARGDVTQVAQMLRLLSGRAEGLTALLSDLLALAQADAPLQQALVDLTDIATSAIAEARMAVDAGANAEVRLQPLPAARGASALLRQVFVNLIGNALKYSRNADRPLVEIGVGQADAQCALYVRDNGIGFDCAQAERLFQPFVRLHGSEYSGHGIGLSFVKQVVERHGGRIWADTRSASGATFYFTLAGLA